MPNVLSVDVGIKNLSYCLLKVGESLTHPHHREIEILNWNTLNLNDADEVKPSVQPLDVHCTTKPGCKLKPCYFYVDGVTDADMYACKRHYKTAVAGTRRVFEMKPTHISKVMKTFTLEKMRDFCTEHGTAQSCAVKTKAEFRTLIIDIFKTKYVYPVGQRDLYASIIRPPVQGESVTTTKTTTTVISQPKKLLTLSSSNSSTVSLVFVGYNLMKSFDALFYGGHQPGSPGVPVIDAVVIENQISPIANRMKTVQGMITQYFLMRGVDKRRIVYFSAVQKLKVAPYHFVFHNNSHGPKYNNNATDDADADVVDDIQTYDERKKAGVACVRKILSAPFSSTAVSNDPVSSPITPVSPGTPKLFSIAPPSPGSNIDWLNVFESHGKKDDMADSFLQGLSYIVKTENKCELKSK